MPTRDLLFRCIQNAPASVARCSTQGVTGVSSGLFVRLQIFVVGVSPDTNGFVLSFKSCCFNLVQSLTFNITQKDSSPRACNVSGACRYCLENAVQYERTPLTPCKFPARRDLVHIHAIGRGLVAADCRR